MTASFDADWLTLREPFDAAARNAALARRLAAALPRRPRLLDLGAGTGSLVRWLAPIIGRAQVWTLADGDAELLLRGFDDIAAWAARRGWTVTKPGRALLVHAPFGALRVEAVCVDLVPGPAVLPLKDTDAVVCSALLDLVSASWIERLAQALRTPLLACLTVDGRDAVLPSHPLDARVRAGFRRDQGRDKGFGPALGPRATATLHAALARRGFALASAPSDWRIPASALGMLRELIQGHAGAASRAHPSDRRAIETWRDLRMRQAIAGRLAIRIGHRDSLALPPR